MLDWILAGEPGGIVPLPPDGAGGATAAGGP